MFIVDLATYPFIVASTITLFVEKFPHKYRKCIRFLLFLSHFSLCLFKMIFCAICSRQVMNYKLLLDPNWHFRNTLWRLCIDNLHNYFVWVLAVETFWTADIIEWNQMARLTPLLKTFSIQIYTYACNLIQLSNWVQTCCKIDENLVLEWYGSMQIFYYIMLRAR